jgi:putative phosphoribosyl transferase
VYESDLRFRDRRDAGRALAGEIAALSLVRPIVLALPRGGVPVGAEVADRLGAPLDVIVARKVGMPGQPEYAIGAVAEGADGAVMRHRADELGLTRQRLAGAVEAAMDEVRRRVDVYRGDGALPELEGRTAVVVDDGLATGATAEAAVLAARSMRAADVVLAVPVGAPDTVHRLSRDVRVVCLSTPERFTAVGLWYDDFDQTTDEQVLEILDAHRPHS